MLKQALCVLACFFGEIQRVLSALIGLPTMGVSLPMEMVCWGSAPWASAAMGPSHVARSMGRAKFTGIAGVGRVAVLLLLASGLGSRPVEGVVALPPL